MTNLLRKYPILGGEDKVDAGFIRDGKELPLGFIFEKNPDPFNNKVSVTVAGDFWSTGFNEATFVDTLSQIYQKHNVITQLEANGFIVNSIETNAEDEIEIKLMRMLKIRAAFLPFY